MRDVHAQYLRAGADIIETNTFGANRMKLRAFGLGEPGAAEINQAAAALAREARDAAPASRAPTWPGAIGPLGVRVEPWGKTGVDEAEAIFREQAEALVAGGVDLFMLETFRDLNEMGAAIAAVRAASDLPIVAQMTTEEDGNSLDGTPPEQFAPALVARGAHVVGLNCSVGPAPMLETVERMAGVVSVPLAAQPNAGKPRDIEGRNLYLCSPDYMASYARRFVGAGVRLVGGCCGTTPEHIRQIALAVKAMAPGVARAMRRRPRRRTPRRQPAACAGARAPGREVRAWRGKLAAGQFVTIVEVPPPRGHDATEAVADGRAPARTAASTSSTVPDGPRSGARLSALSLAVLDAAAARHRDAAPVLVPRSQSARASSRICWARTRSGCATCSASPATRAASATSPTPRRCSTSTRSG